MVRDRSKCRSMLKIDMISPEEIAEAVKIIVKRSYGIDRPDAAAAAARILGFARVSENIRTRVDSAISHAVAQNELVDDEGHLTLADSGHSEPARRRRAGKNGGSPRLLLTRPTTHAHAQLPGSPAAFPFRACCPRWRLPLE